MIPIGLYFYCFWRFKIFTQTFIREYFRLQDRIKHFKKAFKEPAFLELPESFCRSFREIPESFQFDNHKLPVFPQLLKKNFLLRKLVNTRSTKALRDLLRCTKASYPLPPWLHFPPFLHCEFTNLACIRTCIVIKQTDCICFEISPLSLFICVLNQSTFIRGCKV